MADDSSQSGEEGINQSVYAPWKIEIERISRLKSDFENKLRFPNYGSDSYRQLIINSARIMLNEFADLILEEDYNKIFSVINRMVNLDSQILSISMMSVGGMQKQMVIYNNANVFGSFAHQFLKEFNSVAQKYNMGLKMRKADSDIQKLYKIFQVKNKFQNKFGVPISLEMEMLARIASIRVRHEWDNVFFVEGSRGNGKSMFSYSLGTTIAEKNGIEFDLERNLIFNESKEYVTKRIKVAIRGDVIILDEAGNQANSRTWWEEDQISFMNLVNLIRFHGLTLIVNWPDMKDLDTNLKKTAHGLISIKKRGRGILRTFNQNPYMDKLYKPYGAKDKIAYTGEEAEEVMNTYDKFVSMTIPCYSVPDILWDKYRARKEVALKAGNIGKMNTKSTMIADDYYVSFLLKHPLDKLEITSQDLESYGKQNGVFLSMKKLVQTLARATNRKPMNIFVADYSDPTKADVGYVKKDEYINKYIENLRAMREGSEQLRKDLEEKQDEGL